uniref:Helitron helicase-like domain-containing protein n=2 Tax=Chenopodium quinoa TaxID=63459 RepID=A0A803KZG7_CHEQI
MTPEQLTQEANTRNAQRRMSYNLRRKSQQNATASSLRDITNQSNSNARDNLADPTSRLTSMGNCQNSVREIGESSGTSNTNHHNVMHVNIVDERIIRQRVNPRSAINFHERRGVPNVQLCPPRLCSHCQARLFHKESSQICCMSGKIILPTIPVPAELLSLYTDQTPIGVDFRYNLRKLNHIHAFTSMGVHIDESLANAQQGVYTFRAQGSIYHKIGGLLSNGSDCRPRFLQLYIYDTEHEIENRLAENSTCDETLYKESKLFWINAIHLSILFDL